MKKAIGVLVIVVVAGGGVLLLRPDFLEKMMPGFYAEKHRSSIRERATQLITYLAQDDFDRCVDLVDPVFVREHGAKAVKLRFGIIAFVAKAGKLTPNDVQITDVQLSSDNRSAVVHTRLRIQGEWKDQKPGRWIRVGSQWYSSPDM